MILGKSEEHTEENQSIHGTQCLLPDTHLLCLILISVKQCHTLLQEQKSGLQFGARRISKTVPCNIPPLTIFHVYLLYNSHNHYWQQ